MHSESKPETPFVHSNLRLRINLEHSEAIGKNFSTLGSVLHDTVTRGDEPPFPENCTLQVHILVFLALFFKQRF